MFPVVSFIFLFFTFSTLAVRVEICENGSGGVSRAHQSGTYQSFSLLAPDDFHFRIVHHVFLELGFEMSYTGGKKNIFINSL